MPFFPDLDSIAYTGSRPHPIGRPPKLTQEMIEKIADLIVAGKSIAAAAYVAGISESTIYRWLANGRKRNADKIYKELVDRVSEACEFSELEALQVLRQSSLERSNWRAAAWILERRHPEKYGKRVSQQSPNNEVSLKSSQENQVTDLKVVN